jgi:hypothetical protein
MSKGTLHSISGVTELIGLEQQVQFEAYGSVGGWDYCHGACDPSNYF